MDNVLEIKIPPLKDYISAVRYTAGVYANSLGFDLEKIEDIRLVVGEACNNAVLYGDKSINEIRVIFSHDEKSLFIEIIDKGYGFELDQYENPNLDDPNEGGFGIYIIKKLSDEFSFKSDKSSGTVLSIKFNIV